MAAAFCLFVKSLQVASKWFVLKDITIWAAVPLGQQMCHLKSTGLEDSV